MKQNLFYPTSSGQVVRQLGFGFDFTKPYYEVSLSSKRARFGVEFSRLPAVLAVTRALYSVVKVIYRLFGGIFEAFRIVISSPVV